MQLLPAVDNAFAHMQEARVVVNASLGLEGFGLTVIEAMAAGCIVIGPNKGGPAQTIQPGHTGYLFEQGNLFSLVETLKKALATGEPNASIRQQALAYVEKHDAYQTIRQLEEAYEEITPA